MNKSDILKALDQMEEARINAGRCPEAYPPDYIFRLCEAITARLAGYHSREAWTDDLLQDDSTTYSRIMNED